MQPKVQYLKRSRSGLKRASIFLYNVRVGESGITYFGRESRVDSDTRPGAGRRPTAAVPHSVSDARQPCVPLAQPTAATTRYTP